MATFKFTKAKLHELPPAPHGKQIEHHDSQVKGLRIRIGSSGLKVFCVVRKVKGKFFRTALGRFPDLTVDMARTAALDTLGGIGLTGRNPNAVKRENEAAEVVLMDAMELYIKTRGHRLKETTANQYRRLLSNFSGDWLGRPLANISRDSVFNRHKAITDGTAWFGEERSTLRSGVGCGSKAQADLWGRALRAILNFAHDHYRDETGQKLLPEPPTIVLSTKRQWHGLERKNTRIRNHELGRWLRAVEAVRVESLDWRDDHAVSICDALDMALFTGLRRGEVFGLEWDRVNLDGGYFWIDKTKNGDPLELPVTETLRVIFERRLKLRSGDNPYVFPSARGGQITDPRKIISKITSKTATGTGINERVINFTCHDARRTYATIAELSGVGTYILKRLMNHRSGRTSDTTQGYISLPVEELIEPAAKIEAKILYEAGIKNSNHTSDYLLKDLSDDERVSVIEFIKKLGVKG